MEDNTAGDKLGVQVCSSSVLSLRIPNLCLLQYIKVVNDYLGPAILSLLGGVLRKDKKNKYGQHVLLMLGISREKIMALGAASPLLHAGVRVSPGHFICHL